MAERGDLAELEARLTALEMRVQRIAAQVQEVHTTRQEVHILFESNATRLQQLSDVLAAVMDSLAAPNARTDGPPAPPARG